MARTRSIICQSSKPNRPQRNGAPLATCSQSSLTTKYDLFDLLVNWTFSESFNLFQRRCRRTSSSERRHSHGIHSFLCRPNPSPCASLPSNHRFLCCLVLILGRKRFQRSTREQSRFRSSQMRRMVNPRYPQISSVAQLSISDRWMWFENRERMATLSERSSPISKSVPELLSFVLFGISLHSIYLLPMSSDPSTRKWRKLVLSLPLSFSLSLACPLWIYAKTSSPGLISLRYFF